MVLYIKIVDVISKTKPYNVPVVWLFNGFLLRIIGVSDKNAPINQNVHNIVIKLMNNIECIIDNI